MKRHAMIRFFAVLLFAALLFALPGAAEEKKEVVYELIPFGVTDSDAVWNVQVALEKLYYLSVSDGFVRGTFDVPTSQALHAFCEDHNVTNLLPPEGITPRLQKYLLEESPAPRATDTPEPVVITDTPAPEDTPFPVFVKGDTAEIIGNVQEALWQRGYFEGIEGSYVSGRLDDVTETALKRFCEVIQAEYVPEAGLTAFLYNRVMASNAPEYPRPTEAPVQVINYDSRGEQVRQAQQRLYDLGYFRDLDEPEWDHYDVPTANAVRLFCQVNGVPEHPNGIDMNIWDRLMGDGAKPNPVPRTEIDRGAQNENVRIIQDRLNDLGYYKNRQRTGACDADMLAAVADFARANHISYQDGPISVALQEDILRENAIPYSEQAVKTGFGENVQKFLTGPVHFMGIGMPAWVMIMAIVVILALLVFLLIRAFSTDTKKEPAKPDTKDTWSGGKAAGGGARTGRVELEISYRGSTRMAAVSLDKPLRIGRSEGTLPLDESDSDISRRHCQLYFRGDALLLRDYSTNGTKVNGQPYHNCECVIHDGDSIQLGSHEIRVRIQ